MIRTCKLSGCGPSPLANYLKALAVFRLIHEQEDGECRAWWEDDGFYLGSSLGEEEIEDFFLHDYEPTPIVAPWNGGSGFYPKDRKKGIDPIKMAVSPRFEAFRDTIKLCEQVLDAKGTTKPPSGASQKDLKTEILLECRNSLPDESMTWLDAAFVFSGGRVQYPPLLGTGGNDGRLEFTNNYMQRLVELIDPESGLPSKESESFLLASLWDTTSAGLKPNLPIGQFLPQSAGGANAGPGYEAQSLVNPWDFIFALEGALTFGSAATRRLEVAEGGLLSGPFTVRPSHSGYAAATPNDKGRAEIWLPLWQRPSTYLEIQRLFSEGRSQVGRRRSRNGVDFARAVSTLGVDRGVSSFERTGFLERNGQAYLATPLGRWPVRLSPEVHLLDDIDEWLYRFGRVGSSDTTPGSLRRAYRRIETAILDVCKTSNPSQWQRLVAALGEAERQMVKSPKTTREGRLTPLPLLRPEWVQEADDGSAEFLLACSLASIYDGNLGPLRANMVPLARWGKKPQFNLDKMDDNEVVWGDGALTDNLLRVLKRRLLGTREKDLERLPIWGRWSVSLDDIRRFIEGSVDDEKVTALVWGLNAIDWKEVRTPRLASEDLSFPIPAPYAVLRLSHYPGPVRTSPKEEGVVVPLDPGILARAHAGQISSACKLAARRLRASGLPPKTDSYFAHGKEARRMAGALLFPIGDQNMFRLSRMVLKSTGTA